MFESFHRLPKWIKAPLFIIALPFIIAFGLLQFIVTLQPAEQVLRDFGGTL